MIHRVACCGVMGRMALMHCLTVMRRSGLVNLIVVQARHVLCRMLLSRALTASLCVYRKLPRMVCATVGGLGEAWAAAMLGGEGGAVGGVNDCGRVEWGRGACKGR